MASFKVVDMKEILREELYMTIIDETDDIDEIDECMDGIEVYMSECSMMELDSYYINGINEEDMDGAFLPKNIYCMAIGVAMVERYGLSDSQYTEWASKQKPEVAYNLYKIIGEERNNLKRRAEADQNIEKKRQREDYIEQDRTLKSAMEKLALKSQILEVNSEGEYCVLNSQIRISSEVMCVVALRDAIDDSMERVYEVLVNRLFNSCESPIECNAKLRSILNDTQESLLIKIKREVSDNDRLFKEIDDFATEYIEFAHACSEYISNIMHEKFMQGFSFFEDELEDVITRESLEIPYNGRFSTIGFGLGGLLKGMVKTTILNKIDSAIVNSRRASQYKREKQDAMESFVTFGNELFYGKASLDLYGDLIDHSVEYLQREIEKRILKNIQITELDISLKNMLDVLSRQLTGDKLRALSLELLTKYPFEEYTYVFLLDNYSNMSNILLPISEKLGIVGYVANWENTWNISTTESERSYLDVKKEKDAYEKEELFRSITCLEKKSVIDKLRFRVLMKMLINNSYYNDNYVGHYKFDFEDEDYDIPRFLDKRAYILYKSDNIIVYDSGIYFSDGQINLSFNECKEFLTVSSEKCRMAVRYYSKKTEEIDFTTNFRDELSFVTTAINIALDKIVKVERYYSRKQRNPKTIMGLCISCDSFAKARIEGAIFTNSICTKCGGKNTMVQVFTEEHYYEMCDSINEGLDESLISDEKEILELLQETLGTLAVDNDFSLERANAFNELYNSYEKCMKATIIRKICLDLMGKNKIVGKYDYEWTDLRSRGILENEGNLGQFVLYADDGIIITDKRIYLWSQAGENSYSFDDVIEIVPVKDAYVKEFTGAVVIYKKFRRDKTSFICNDYVSTDKNNFVKVFTYLNIALGWFDLAMEIENNRLFMGGEKNAPLLFCKSRDRFSYEFDSSTLFYVPKCEACDESIKKNHYYVAYIDDKQKVTEDTTLKYLRQYAPFDFKEYIKNLGEEDILYQAFEGVKSSKAISEKEGSEREVVRDIADRDESVINLIESHIRSEMDKEEKTAIEKQHKFCTYCGGKLVREAKFCNYCGKKCMG